MDFLLDGSVVGQFDSRLYNGRIGPKISMRGDIFVKEGFQIQRETYSVRHIYNTA